MECATCGARIRNEGGEWVDEFSDPQCPRGTYHFPREDVTR